LPMAPALPDAKPGRPMAPALPTVRLYEVSQPPGGFWKIHVRPNRDFQSYFWHRKFSKGNFSAKL
jgi:hypothetical protein